MVANNDHPERASATDGCPNCVANVEPPRETETTDHGFVAHYVCTDCGHRWETGWVGDGA